MVKSFAVKAAAVVASCALMFTIIGIFSAFSQYFQVLVDSFDSNYATFGFIATSMASVCRFVGPLPGYAIELFSYKIVIVGSVVLLAFSFWLASLSTAVWHFWFSYSLLCGIFIGFLHQYGQSLVVDFVDSNEISMGLHIINIAAGLGNIFFGCFAAYATIVHDYWSWNQLFRGFGVCVMATAVFVGLLMMIMPNTIDREGEKVTDEEVQPIANDEKTRANRDSHVRVERKYGYELLWVGDPAAWSLTLSNFFTYIIDLVPIKFAVIYANSGDAGPNINYYVPIAIGLGAILCRVVMAVEPARSMNPMLLHKVVVFWSLLMCIMFAFLPSSDTFLVLVMLGIYSGSNSILYPVIIMRTIEVLGKREYMINFGVQIFTIGASALFGGYFAGSIYDSTGSYFYVFMLCVGFFLFSFLFDEVAFSEHSLLMHMFNWALGREIKLIPSKNEFS